MDNNKFWKGKKVMLTGHTGFKGSWLSLWLQSLGAKVTGYALEPPTSPSLFEIAHVGDKMSKSHIADIRDLDTVKEKFQEHKPEVVFHMAAQSLVRYSYDNPVETYNTNVMGTVNILEAVRSTSSVKVVVNITSDKCYENKEWLWGYRENEPMGGFDPYSNSKGCAELVTSAYRDSFFGATNKNNVALASARAGNVIGGGDWAEDRLIPDIIRAAIDNKPVIIRNPNAIRPWQHVLEPLAGYLLLAEKLWNDGTSFSEAWNFGPREEDAKSVGWIVQNLAEIWDNKVNWEIDDDSEHPHEATYLKLDCSKASNKLDWRPRWDLDVALLKIVEWYQAYINNKNMREVTLKQINEYLQ